MNRSGLLAVLAPLLLVTGCLDNGGADNDTTAGDAVEDTTPSCESITPGSACSAGAACDSGTECCCGQCYPSNSCFCNDGAWVCYATDACYSPQCSDTTEADTTEPDTTEPADTAPPVDTTEPADTAPPADTTEPADTTALCPAATPNFDDACAPDGLQCGFGQECCCGACHPSLSCTCSGGSWACFATDACFHPACAGCDAARDTLATTLYAKQQGFTVVVRLDHNSLNVLGYAVVAGAYGGVDEATARATAQAATDYGDQGVLLSGANPADDWVFYESPGDFGGAAVVSARTGLAVFGGSIIWMGTGSITWPTAWSPASDLASGCASSGGFGATKRGFDLVNGTSLSASAVDAALAKVADTAVLPAIWQGGYAFDAVVLRYPRSVGVFDPTTAEWIVLISGGWLE